MPGLLMADYPEITGLVSEPLSPDCPGGAVHTVVVCWQVLFQIQDRRCAGLVADSNQNDSRSFIV